MKILKIFGIVAGIHAVALLLIFANPGCSSSSTGRPPATADTAPPPAPADRTPVITAPVGAPEAAPIAAPAPAATDSANLGGTAFYAPTRPGNLAASALAAQPVSGVTPATTYTVAHGDSLWSIAKKNHLKVSELAAANNLRPGATLHLGQKLLIPSKGMAETGAEEASAPASAAPAVATPSSSTSSPGGAIKHVVQRGETLGSIARKYGVKAADLGAANAITDPRKIHPGMELTIPAGGHGPRASRAAAPAKTEPAPAPLVPTINVEPSSPRAPADLNAGLKPANDANVPVIKIDSSPETSNPPKQ